jgi:hypothetical protein
MAYEINININDVTGAGAGEKTPAGVSATPTSTEQQKALKSLGRYVSAQVVQPFINTVKSNVTTNIQTVTGNTELQQRVNFGFEIAQFGMQTFQNVQAGALIGAGLGIGGVAGGAIGLALTAISTGIEIYGNKRQIDLQERLENKQLEQVRQRAGAMYNRSRRG